MVYYRYIFSLKSKELDVEKEFHIGDILSVTTGKALSPHLMDGLTEILEYMVREELQIYQMGPAARECTPYLLAEMPWLADISTEDVDHHNIKEWLERVVSLYGEFHVVRPIHPEDHDHVSLIEGVQRMAGSKKVVEILPEDDEISPYGTLPPKSD
jgi:D-mannonate dehydratase